MVERIRTLLAERQLTPTQFADLIGVGRPIISHILSGRNKPSLEVIQKVIAAFPDLALPWLLSATGPMWVGLPASEASVPAKPPKKAAASLPVPPAATPAAAPPPAAAQTTPAPPLVVPVPAPAITAVPAPTEPPASPPVAPPKPPQPAVPPAATPAKTAPSAANPVSTSSVSASEVALAQALAEPDKAIRRIVFFYQDGTFSAYQPE